MPRLPRIHVSGVLHYITQKSAHDKSLFLDQADYEFYTDLLVEYKRKYGFKLFAYGLFQNHLHLAIEPNDDVNVSVIMRDLTSRYSKYHNGRYEGRGPLFKGRFKTTFVEKETHLFDTVKHIHQLPIILGHTETSESYLYTSYHQYVPKSDTKSDLAALMNSDIAEVLENAPHGTFEQHFSEALNVDEARQISAELNKPVFGTAGFQFRIQRAMEEAAKPAPEEKPEVIINKQVKSVSKGVKLALSAGSVLVVCAALAIPYMYKQNNVLEDVIRQKDAEIVAKSKIQKELEKSKSLVDTKKAELEAIASAPHQNKDELILILNGTEWEMQFTPISGEGPAPVAVDRIRFDNDTLISNKLEARGFSPAHYSMLVKPNGRIMWETVQHSPQGEVVSWRGEWNGTQMTGIYNKKGINGDQQTYNFVGAFKAGYQGVKS